jgi:hypothetical protein
MVKKSGSPRAGSQAAKNIPGKEVKADSGPAGSGSVEFYVNDAGEICFGSECVAFRFKPGVHEVRVKIDRNKCGADLQPLIDSLYQELGQGAPTVYETVSKREESK